MKESPSFSLYAQDFLTGVMYLTNEEKGIYITMLCKQWTDNTIPKKRLGLLVGFEWEKLSEELKKKFVDYGDYVVNSRLEEERGRKNNFLKKQYENGSKGGRPPKKTTISKTQTKAKKTLYEIEIEEEKEIRKGKNEKGKTPAPEITLPFSNEVFRAQWSHWKVFKAKEFNFKYKSLQSEQAALSELAKKSGNDQKMAIAIIHQSMANGWKGFFELKSKDNNKPTFSTNR